MDGIEPELSASHSLVSQKECSYWHMKAQGQHLICMRFGHVSVYYVIIRSVSQHQLGTRPLTLFVISWIIGFVLAFSSTLSAGQFPSC